MGHRRLVQGGEDRRKRRFEDEDLAVDPRPPRPVGEGSGLDHQVGEGGNRLEGAVPYLRPPFHRRQLSAVGAQHPRLFGESDDGDETEQLGGGLGLELPVPDDLVHPVAGLKSIDQVPGVGQLQVSLGGEGPRLGEVVVKGAEAPVRPGPFGDPFGLFGVGGGSRRDRDRLRFRRPAPGHDSLRHPEMPGVDGPAGHLGAVAGHRHRQHLTRVRSRGELSRLGEEEEEVSDPGGQLAVPAVGQQHLPGHPVEEEGLDVPCRPAKMFAVAVEVLEVEGEVGVVVDGPVGSPPPEPVEEFVPGFEIGVFGNRHPSRIRR